MLVFVFQAETDEGAVGSESCFLLDFVGSLGDKLVSFCIGCFLVQNRMRDLAEIENIGDAGVFGFNFGYNCFDKF